MLTPIITPTTLINRVDPGLPVIRRIPTPIEPNPTQEVASESEIGRADEAAPVEQTVQPEETPKEESANSIQWWENGSFSFSDILDIINPLHHIPFISTLYRAISGDKIGGVARFNGGAIYSRFGGIDSLISSMVNAVVGLFTGKDIGEHVYAMVFGDPHASKEEAAVAAATQENPRHISNDGQEAEGVASASEEGPVLAASSQRIDDHAALKRIDR